MKSYQLVHQLLELVEEFESDNNGGELSLQNFTSMLLTRLPEYTDSTFSPDVRFGKNGAYAQLEAYQIDNNIGRHFVYMSRYAKSYIKKALDDTPLQTSEDFTALSILLTHDHLSKSELINFNLQEKTSGTEVIRRLIAAELVTQWDDEDDKRGKRVAITAKGRRLVYHIFVEMGYVSKMITGNLTLKEKLSLQYLLQKLEAFHYGFYEERTLLTKEDLKKQVTLLTTSDI
jgi:DNA-binding MarR family transcriptional regulator